MLRNWGPLESVIVRKSISWMRSVTSISRPQRTMRRRGVTRSRVGSSAISEVLEQRLLLFVLGPRWAGTATDGAGLGQGHATTVTWSIVADGTPIPALSQISGESSDPSNLIAFMDGIYGTSTIGNAENAAWFPLIRSAFDRWSSLSGLMFQYVSYDDGAPFSSAGSAYPGQLNVRADMRIGGHRIDGNSGVLAYNFYPNNGEMVIDTDDNFYSNITGNSIRLRNIVAHEAGHGMGIAHVSSSNAAFLMEPFIDTSFDGPQFDDILAAHRHYGDIYERNGGNDTALTATSLGSVSSSQTVSIGTDANSTVVTASATDFVSIDDESDIDFYSFTLNTPGNVSIQLTPKGPTYNSGPPNGTQTSFNATSQSDLALALIGTNGSTVLASRNETGLGGSESISDFYVSAAGTYYVRVTGATVDKVQMYQLDVSHNAIAEVAGRHVFYKNAPGSLFDSSGAANAAIDTTKQALLPGETTSFANYTNYIRGLNGLLVDVHNLPSTEISANNFRFEVWNGITTDGWTVSTVSPTAINVLPGAGVGNSSRIRIEFPDYNAANPSLSLQNTWLKVTMLADAATGLATDDVFYFGHALGDFNVGNFGTPITVRTDASDTAVVRLNQSISLNSVGITNTYDINKDGRVDASDTALVRLNQSPALIRFFTAEAGGGNFAGALLADGSHSDDGDVSSGELGDIPLSTDQSNSDRVALSSADSLPSWTWPDDRPALLFASPQDLVSSIPVSSNPLSVTPLSAPAISLWGSTVEFTSGDDAGRMLDWDQQSAESPNLSTMSSPSANNSLNARSPNRRIELAHSDPDTQVDLSPSIGNLLTEVFSELGTISSRPSNPFSL